MSPGYDLCPSVSSVVPVLTLARTKASIEAAELSGIAARRMRPDRVSRYLARFRLGLAWFVPRSITSTAPAIRIFPDFTAADPVHSMTLSARARIDGGTVRPSVVGRLIAARRSDRLRLTAALIS